MTYTFQKLAEKSLSQFCCTFSFFSVQGIISVKKLILIQMATFIFWNELGHPLKPMINTFVLPTFVLAIAKTHPCVKSISIKYRVNKIK